MNRTPADPCHTHGLPRRLPGDPRRWRSRRLRQRPTSQPVRERQQQALQPGAEYQHGAGCKRNGRRQGRPAANQPQTVPAVVEQTTNVSNIQVGSSTGCTTPACPGVYLIGDDPLVDPATAKRVGSLVFVCFRVDTLSHLLYCPAVTMTLWDRGQLVFTHEVLWRAAGDRADHWGHR